MYEVFATRLRELRKEKGLTQEELADLVGISKSAISNYEISYATPTMSHLRLLAKALNVNILYLSGESNLRERFTELIDGIRIPVFHHLDLNAISRGTESSAESIIELPKSAQIRDDDLFAIQMWNDSMAVDHIFKNDYVILRRTSEINNGRIYLVIVNGLAYLHRVTRKEDTLLLTPNSEKRKYKPLQVFMNQAEIVGCAVQVITNV